MIEIPKSEFDERVRKVQDAMKKNHLDGIFVYGDEYRRENLRYLSNLLADLRARSHLHRPNRGPDPSRSP